jgi:hypothetical protein
VNGSRCDATVTAAKCRSNDPRCFSAGLENQKEPGAPDRPAHRLDESNMRALVLIVERLATPAGGAIQYRPLLR